MGRSRFKLLIALLTTVGCDAEGQARAAARAKFEPRAADPGQANADPSAREFVETTEVAAEPTEEAEEGIDSGGSGEPLAEPTAPPDYGQLKPSLPLPAAEDLTFHALAGYEVVAIYDRPDIEAPKLGYLRLGARLRVTPRVEGDGCPKGWHGLPQGGFACASKGLMVDANRPPFMQAEPPPPRLDGPFPYDYAKVTRWNAPMWWRVPREDEIKIAEAHREVREAERVAVEAAKDGGSTLNKATPKLTPASHLPSVLDPFEREDQAVVEPDSADVVSSAGAGLPPLTGLPLKPEDSWLERGFYISLAEKLVEQGHSWWRTARGGYVDAGHAAKYTPKDFPGVELAADVAFPFGFVMAKEAKLFELGADNRPIVLKNVEYRTFVALTEEIELGGKAYMLTPEGHLLRKSDLRLAEPQPIPDGVAPWERWIDVSLAKQMLVAYEGARPVFVTLVSSGKKGTPEEPLETNPGRWRIRSKHVSTTMDGPAVDGNYSIQDVPWTMYFDGNYALHGAFWHQGFGRPRSHGCVNLGATAARWLFFWTTPFLPEGWHGVHAHAGSPGTTVIIRP